MNTAQMREARLKWLWQKHNAKRRNIAFELEFEQWLQIWLDSGHWHQRGISKANQYVMSRINDQGAYRMGNVEIKTNYDNVLEGNQGRKKPQPKMSCLHCRRTISADKRYIHFTENSCLRAKKSPTEVGLAGTTTT